MNVSTNAQKPTRAWLRIARRELAGGIGGFWIFLACLALGAWAIAAAGSITSSYNAGLDRQSHELLGGDAAVTGGNGGDAATVRIWFDCRQVASGMCCRGWCDMGL